jgi:hypothetical protein
MNFVEFLTFAVLMTFFATAYLSKYRVTWSSERARAYHVLPEYSSVAYRCLDDLGRTPVKLVLSSVKTAPWMRIE